jgi:predicted ATPase/DNA-binding XRE family transcriptional regulator
MAHLTGMHGAADGRKGGIALSESFGAVLRGARTAAALTQEELAARAQMSDRGLRYLERGLRRPNRETVERLAAALGLSSAAEAAFFASARPRGADQSVRAGALPVPPHPLVGREEAIVDVRERLSDQETRLLTLTGPGGVGKTILALVTAAELRAAFPDGVTWVPLGSLADAALLPTTVAHALGLMDAGARRAVDVIRAALGERPSLVVLDNLEHLDAAGFVADLVAACPQLTVLATSRSPLGIRAEQEFPVRPLPTPRDLPGLPVHAVATNPSVDLFLRRARAVQPDFVLTDTNATTVAAICRRLDGLPLAIELAAARIRVLPPQLMLDRLEDRLAFLTGGARDVPPRQRAMRSTVAWSYELLSASHREVFEQVAVFDGTFSLAALEAVLPTDPTDPTALLDAVESLHRSNLLLLVDSTDDDPRFRMLGTIRDFALERQQHRRDAGDLQDRHARYYLMLAEEAARGFYGPESAQSLDRLEDDGPNIRAALRWFHERRDTVRGLRLCAALWWFWYVRGYATEGRAQLAAFLALPLLASGEADQPRAEALLGAGSLAHTQGDYIAAADLLATSVRLYRSLGDERSTSAALLAAGFTARVREDYQGARDLLHESLALARHNRHWFVVAAALHHLGMIAVDDDGDLTAAQQLLEESLTLYRAQGMSRFIALVQLSLADVAAAEGNYPRAHKLLTDGLSSMRQVGERLGIHGALDSVARVAAAELHWPQAVTIAAAAERIRRATNSRSWPVVERNRRQWLGQARGQMSDPEYALAWARGEALTPSEAIDYALNEAGACPDFTGRTT